MKVAENQRKEARSMPAGFLRGRVRDLLERAASGEKWWAEDECEDCRQHGTCVCFGQQQHGIPFSFLRMPSSIWDGKKGGCWNIQSYCDLVFAVVCSWRHVGASDRESFRFNAMIAIGLCMDLIPASPFPSNLSDLLLRMAETRIEPESNDDQRTASGCAFSKELYEILEHIMQLSNAALRPWMQQCSSAILALQAPHANSTACFPTYLQCVLCDAPC